MRKFDDAVDRVPVRASPDDAEQMGANGRGSKVGRIDPSHRDTSARPTPGPHIGFICLPTLIIAQTHPAWRDRFASTPSKLYLRADYRRRTDGHFYRRQLEGFADRSWTGEDARRGCRGWRGLGARDDRHCEFGGKRPARGARRRVGRALEMQLGIFAKTFPGREPAQVLVGGEGRRATPRCSTTWPAPDCRRCRKTSVPVSPKRWRGSSGRSGVSIAGLSATYNMIHPDPAVRRRAMPALPCSPERPHDGHAAADALHRHARPRRPMAASSRQ